MVIIMEFKIGGDAKQLDSDMVYTVFGKLIRKGKPMIKLAYRKDIWLLPLSKDLYKYAQQYNTKYPYLVEELGGLI